MQADFLIPGSKCGSGTCRKLQVDIKLIAEFEEWSLLMLYPFSAVVTLKRSRMEWESPAAKAKDFIQAGLPDS